MNELHESSIPNSVLADLLRSNVAGGMDPYMCELVEEAALRLEEQDERNIREGNLDVYPPSATGDPDDAEAINSAWHDYLKFITRS